MSTTAPTESSEIKELSLVGKVELRIALADSDSKLESILKTFLAPLLLKLASEHVSVRNKVRQYTIKSLQPRQACLKHLDPAVYSHPLTVILVALRLSQFVSISTPE